MFRAQYQSEVDMNYQYLRNKSTVKKDKHLSQNIIKKHQKNKENIQRLNNTYHGYQQSHFPNDSYVEGLSSQKWSQKNNGGCANHQNKSAEFEVNIQGEALFYCEKCATQVASQGFKVQRINSTRQAVSFPLRNLHSLATLDQYSSCNSHFNKPLKQRQRQIQLKSFTKKLTKLEEKYQEKKRDLNNICESFQLQRQNCNTYYDELINHIQEMRKAHIQAIEQESAKNVQICEIETGQVQESLKDVQEMLLDINSNIDSIVEEIDDESYFECLTYYKQKQGVFSHRLQELGSEARAWPSTDEQTFLLRLQNFKNFLDELHNIQANAGQSQSRLFYQSDSHSQYYS